MLGMIKAGDVLPLADYFGLEELQGLLAKHMAKVIKMHLDIFHTAYFI